MEKELGRILSQSDSLLFQAMRYAVLGGGKRFRPLLVLSSGEFFKVSEEILLPFACALELIHNYSLIHDDLPCMDNDDFRRGKPSCHKTYGEEVALLAGDGLLTLAFETLAEAPVEERLLRQKNKLIEEISRLAGVKGMIEGQLMDIISSPKMTEDEYLSLVLKKTASLIIASVKVGALLGEATPLQMEGILEYGRNLGLAFQIRDDILDSLSDEKHASLARPNSVLLFGLEVAREKLSNFVRKANQALQMAEISSEELFYLASILLDGNGGKE